MLAPICLFVYSRLEETKRTIEALKENHLAKDSDLIIFSDAPKSIAVENEVIEVRAYIKLVDGFRSVSIIEAEKNSGLAKSIIEGVTKVVKQYGKVIVLEDDLVTSKNFLDFINQALDFYKDHKSVFSIAGYTTPIQSKNVDIYYTKRASSWGWGTWGDRWVPIDWELDSYSDIIKSKSFRSNFNAMGSDMSKMLFDQIKGRINSWAIRWCLHQFTKDMYTVYPTMSKVQNIGTGTTATHTKDNAGRFYTELDSGDKREFGFNNNVNVNPFYLGQFLKQYSISTRIKFKILNFFS